MSSFQCYLHLFFKKFCFYSLTANDKNKFMGSVSHSSLMQEEVEMANVKRRKIDETSIPKPGSSKEREKGGKKKKIDTTPKPKPGSSGRKRWSGGEH